MSDTANAYKRFARNLFASASDDDQGLDDDKQGQRADSAADDGLDEQRRWAEQCP